MMVLLNNHPSNLSPPSDAMLTIASGMGESSRPHSLVGAGVLKFLPLVDVTFLCN